jgi:lipopolysaccharide exporter
MAKKIKINSFFGNVIKTASGQIGAQLLGVLFLPIISRLYTPAHFGEYGLFMAIFGILSPLMGGKYEIACVLESNTIKRTNLFFLSIIISVIIFISSTLLILLFKNNIIDVFSLNFAPNLLLILPIFLLFFGITQATNYYLVSYKYFGKNALKKIIEKVSSISIKLTTGFLNPVTINLIAAELISKFLNNLYSTYIILHHKLLNFKHFRLAIIVNLQKKYRNFFLYELPSDWFNSISNKIPLLLMGYFFNPAIVGFFVFAENILRKFIVLGTQNFGVVYYQHIAETNDRKEFTLTLIRFFSIFGIYPFIILLIAAPELFSFIFGAKWHHAGVYTQIMVPYLIILYYQKPLNSLYRIYGYQHIILYLNIINLILFVFAVIIGGLIENEILMILFVTVAGIIIYGWQFLWILHKIGITPLALIKQNIKYIFISCIILTPLILSMIFSLQLKFILFSIVLSTVIYSLYVYIYEKKAIKAIINR